MRARTRNNSAIPLQVRIIVTASLLALSLGCGTVSYYSQAARVSDEYNFKGRGRTYTLGYSLDF